MVTGYRIFDNETEVRTFLETHLGPMPDDIRIGPDQQGWTVAVPSHHPDALIGAVQDALSGTNASLGWVEDVWPEGPLTPTMGGTCQLVLVGTDEDGALAYYRCTVHSTDDKENIVIGYDTYCEDA